MKVKLNIKGLKNKKSLMIVSIILVVLLAVGGFLTWQLSSKKTVNKSERVSAKVTRGDITNVIEGTGTVEAISQYEITSLAKGDVIADYFEEGDYVSKGQLLYRMDSESVNKSITRQKSSIEKAQMNYDDVMDSISDLNVKSTAGGVITNIYVSKGDLVQQGTKIADVTNKETLLVTLPFGKSDAANIGVGSIAEVTLSSSLTSLSGTVTRVATGTYVNSYGVEVTDVEIEFANPGSVSEGETVSAVVGNYACYDTGTVSHIETRTVTAKTSGEVKGIYKSKGDRVLNGETIIVLESSSIDKSRREAQMSLQDANLSLDDLYDNLEDYSIKSPIDGKVIQKNIKAGEKLDSNSSGAMAIVADLSRLTFDMSIDELDISKISVGQEVSITADALPQQKFVGTVSNISIVGTAYQGVTSYPVTVTIDNTEESELIPGMNVEAQIIVDSVENILRIPVSAVNMGNLVIVKDDGNFSDPDESLVSASSSGSDSSLEERSGEPTDKGESQEKPKGEFSARGGNEKSFVKPENGEVPKDEFEERGNMPSRENMQDRAKERMNSMIENLDVPDGYTVVAVETGLTDGDYIEIIEKEGSLKEGDEVLLSAVTASSDEAAVQGMPGGMGGGMPGGMGGGMPGGMSGGMPGAMGGGMPGGMSGSGGNRQGVR